MSKNGGVKVKREPLMYEQGSSHSFFMDLAKAAGGKDEYAQFRLQRHAIETRTNPNTTVGTGGELAPPAYLTQLFATAAKVGRHFPDLVVSLPIPRAISSINIPRFVGTDILGQDTGIQTSGGAPLTDFDDTSAMNTSPVVTIAGRMVVSQQLYDQAGTPGFDVMAYTELQKDYNAVLAGQMVNGTGTNGQLLGVANFTIPSANTVSGASVPAGLTGASNMIAALWPLLGQAAAAVGNNRGHRPEFWLMAPRRWFAIAGSLDQQSRPVMSPAAQAPGDPMDTSGGPHPVSQIHGVPVFTEGAIPTTTLPGGSVGALADNIYCGRTGDMYLFESEPMLQTSVNATAGNLQVSLILHRYAAFVGNIYSSAIGVVTGIPRPTNY